MFYAQSTSTVISGQAMCEGTVVNSRCALSDGIVVNDGIVDSCKCAVCEGIVGK